MLLLSLMAFALLKDEEREAGAESASVLPPAAACSATSAEGLRGGGWNGGGPSLPALSALERWFRDTGGRKLMACSDAVRLGPERAALLDVWRCITGLECVLEGPGDDAAEMGALCEPLSSCCATATSDGCL